MNLLYLIALTFVKGTGSVNLKTLISYCGSPEQVFKEKKSKLLKIPGVGVKLYQAIQQKGIIKKAEKELRFIEKNKINTCHFYEKEYPLRLKNCIDSPLILYQKGKCDLNKGKFLAIVGTRNATRYGKKITQSIIEDLSHLNITIVSGMALGIDAQAHQTSLQRQLPTIGVLGHPLNMMYPVHHHKLAKNMLKQNGMLLTEYASQHQVLPSNFPMRNRIIAGLSDAVLVVESSVKGGAVITANIAQSYNRDVFAVPGSIDNTFSKGCHHLMKNHKAQLVENAEDIKQFMLWTTEKKKSSLIQKQLALDLPPLEQKIVEFLHDSSGKHIEDMALHFTINQSKLASSLLNLELNGIIDCLPGNLYVLR